MGVFQGKWRPRETSVELNMAAVYCARRLTVEDSRTTIVVNDPAKQNYIRKTAACTRRDRVRRGEVVPVVFRRCHYPVIPGIHPGIRAHG